MILGDKTKKEYKLLLGIIVLAVMAGSYLGFNRSTAANGIENQVNSNPNAFLGKIVSGNLAPQTFENLSVLTDQGCTLDPKTQLSNCTSGIHTQKGDIYFNYEHNMMAKPCLSKGDIISMIVNPDGTAMVTRTYWNGGGAA